MEVPFSELNQNGRRTSLEVVAGMENSAVQKKKKKKCKYNYYFHVYIYLFFFFTFWLCDHLFAVRLLLGYLCCFVLCYVNISIVHDNFVFVNYSFIAFYFRLMWGMNHSVHIKAFLILH